MAKKSSRNTKARIVSAAWKLFYEQGYEETTVEEIIFESETSKGSFYHYFDGKDALLSSLSVLFDERYVNAVMNRGQQFLYEYDEKIQQGESPEILKEANKKIADMVKEESDKALAQILKNASEHMKIRYHRGDN